jgi:tripartite-type tricarboxylate transporter receptor subunit TctC
MRSLSRIGLAALMLASFAARTAAQTPDLAGKNVQMIIGFGPGGGFDLWARLVSRHIGKYLPGNPNVVAQNMPGAGSFNATNYIYNIAPKDGTVMGMIASAAALGPITGVSGARFDPTKITWLGATTSETEVCVAYNSPNVKVKTLQDLYDKELVVGSTGNGALSDAHPRALRALLGLKFKVVAGFNSSSDIFLAMERGEMEGVCLDLAGVREGRPSWIEDKKLVVLFQAGAAPNPELPGVPFIDDSARTPEEKQAIEFLYASAAIGRPFVAPPDLPAGTLKMMRDAFDATMKDPDFLAETKKARLEVNPENGADLAAFVKKIYATPKPIVDKVVAAMK